MFSPASRRAFAVLIVVAIALTVSFAKADPTPKTEPTKTPDAGNAPERHRQNPGPRDSQDRYRSRNCSRDRYRSRRNLQSPIYDRKNSP